MNPYVLSAGPLARVAGIAILLVLAACTREGRDPAAVTGEDPTSTPPVPAVAPSQSSDVAKLEILSDPAAPGALRAAELAAACCAGAPLAYLDADREQYAHFDGNPVRLAREEPVSTFSIDVDTGSYANVRRFLEDGSLPPRDAVRTEELLNYFRYDYPAPASRAQPFAVTTAVAPAPWNRDRLLLQVGIQGYEIPTAKRAPANLVFLVDVSGSMQPDDKLPLLKRSLRLLARQLGPDDRVSLVVYAGAAGAVLPPTPGDRQAEILAALERLEAGGSTNGADGIRLAYDFARQAHIRGGVNRVLLATDGDFNVGTVDFEALVDLVEREREGGVSLTTLGFGTGNYNDRLLERLADAGNGNYAYVDGLAEGRKVLVEQLTGTLQTIAKDVKVQVEFNPALVAEYRLVGYENRVLRREDFNNDRVDAGEIGAGHSVTALYELVPAGSAAVRVDPLRYGSEATAPAPKRGDELAFVRLRWKAPEGGASRLVEQPVRRADVVTAAAAPQEFRFAAAVAAFGELLRGGEHTGGFGYEDVARLAAGARGQDPAGYRGEFLQLVRLAGSLAATADAPAVAGPEGEAPLARR
jgi:Ca-activated chloride channel family protein